jgi:hypothetical protein
VRAGGIWLVTHPPLPVMDAPEMVIVGSCKPPYCAAGINAQPDCAFVLGTAPRFQHGAVPPLGCIANGLPLLHFRKLTKYFLAKLKL